MAEDLSDREASLLAENASLREELKRAKSLAAERALHRIYGAGLPDAAEQECGHDDNKRDALAWASRQFVPVNVEDAHAIGDAVLHLANRYHAWLLDGRTPYEALGHHEGYRDDA